MGRLDVMHRLNDVRMPNRLPLCSCAFNTSGSREQAFAKIMSRSYALCMEGNGTMGSGTNQVRGKLSEGH
jgi:hypothetical protein